MLAKGKLETVSFCQVFALCVGQLLRRVSVHSGKRKLGSPSRHLGDPKTGVLDQQPIYNVTRSAIINRDLPGDRWPPTAP